MKLLVILSSVSQYREFRKRYNTSNVRIFCDNPQFESFLKKEGVVYERLDEFLLKSKWKKINRWGASKASEWGKIYSDVYPRNINLASATFLFFSYILVQMVKNYEFACHLLRTERPDRIFIFDTKEKRLFPDFSGNFFLNYFLEDLAKYQGLILEKAVLEGYRLDSVFPDSSKRFKAMVKNLLRFTLNVICKLTMRQSGKVDVLAYGALRHLEQLLQNLSFARKRLAIYDFDFHLDQFLFARRHKIPYILSDFFVNCNSPDVDQIAAEWIQYLVRAAESPRYAQHWIYEGYNFLPFIRSYIFLQMHDYIRLCLGEKSRLDRLFSQCRIKSVLVDENFGKKRAFFTSYAEQKGVSVYCVSHANLAVDFAVDLSSRYFSNATTFVHSDFEKDMYAARGWNPDRIIVTGLPRYDPLSKGPRRTHFIKTKYSFRLLYCAGVLYGHSPDHVGYLGNHIYCLKEIQEQAFLDILSAIKNLPVSILLKPHDYEDEILWKKLAIKHKSSIDLHFFYHNEKFHKLLRESDAMAVAYWSTAITECAILDKPVFYYEAKSSDGPIVRQYERTGFCKVVYAPEQLREGLKLCLKEPHWCPSASTASMEEKKYYFGLNDGRNSQRVVNRILRGSYG
ncbi:MAG: CDP-glycerol glycerophosphotransferase family protein [Candidatus Omnitrophota bacterium]|jgi:CDP-glycerol glycerophosphotransferase (TagB/SpsB family)